MEPLLAVIAHIVVRILSIFKRHIRLRIEPMHRRRARPSNITRFSVVLLICAVHGYATSVVTFWTDSWVVLGTDSLRLNTGNGARQLLSACKLERVRDVFFAMDGEWASADAKFDARKAARDAMNQPGTMEERFGIFKKNIPNGLARMIPIIQRDDPNLYKQWVRGDSILGVVFAGFENGRTNIIIYQFLLDRATQTNGVRVPFIERRYDTKRMQSAGGGYGYYAGGAGLYVDPAQVKMAYERAKDPKGATEATETLIRAAEISFPGIVALPAQIGVVDGNGPTWAKGPTSCH